MALAGPALWQRSRCGSNRDGSAVWHCLVCVYDQIAHDLTDLTRIYFHGMQIGSKVKRASTLEPRKTKTTDSRTSSSTEEVFLIGDPPLDSVSNCCVSAVARMTACSVSSSSSFASQLGLNGRIGKGNIAQDGGQNIVEIMSDTTSEQPNGIEFRCS